MRGEPFALGIAIVTSKRKGGALVKTYSNLFRETFVRLSRYVRSSSSSSSVAMLGKHGRDPTPAFLNIGTSALMYADSFPPRPYIGVRNLSWPPLPPFPRRRRLCSCRKSWKVGHGHIFVPSSFLFSFLFRIQRAGRNSKTVCRSNGPDGSSGNVLITSKQRRKKKKKKRGRWVRLGFFRTTLHQTDDRLLNSVVFHRLFSFFCNRKRIPSC